MSTAPDQTPEIAHVPRDAGRRVLEVEDLCVDAANFRLLDGVSFSIAGDERVGLIGESGSGKSLTALSVIGLLAENLRASGSVRLDGVELLGAGERAVAAHRGKDVAMVFQEPMTALNPTMKIGKQIAEAMLIHRTKPTKKAAYAEAVALLKQVGLPDAEQTAQKYPHQLSGGQRQRVVIAIALANDPQLLICDEPTTALDVTVQAQVLDLIRDEADLHNAALLFITHDLAVVAAMCHRVLVMYGGRIVEAGTVEEVFTAPRHPYTAGLLASSDLERTDENGDLIAIPGSVPPAGRFPSGCVFRNRCERATEICAQIPPWTPRDQAGLPTAAAAVDPNDSNDSIAPDDGNSGVACFHPIDSPAPADGPSIDVSRETPGMNESAGTTPGGRASALSARRPTADQPVPPGQPNEPGRSAAPIISVRDLTREYPLPRGSLFGPRRTTSGLDAVSFDVHPGERFAIVGESGSGKSTLLRILAGLDEPTSGSVQVSGIDLSRHGKNVNAVRDKLQMVFQDPMSSLDPRMRVRDIVAEPLVAQRIAHTRADIEQLLIDVGVDPEAADRYPHQFSGGQRQRISLARALAPSPSILIADEPVSALDVSVRAQVLNVISALVRKRDLTLVFVSHDLSVVRHLCDRVAVLKDGALVEIGPTERIYDQPRTDYTKTLIASVPTIAKSLAGKGIRDLTS